MSKFIPDFPDLFSFTVPVPVRITDLNYGGHVGNDRILSIIHEARVLYLQHLELSELRFGAAGLIMKNVAIDFVRELFYGEELRVSVRAGDFSAVSFSLYYKLEKIKEAQPLLVAAAKTVMVCFDYTTRKPSPLQESIKQQLI